MPIDSVGSYEDIYSDDIAETLKTNDKPPAAWNGRTVLTSKENDRMHTIQANSLAHKSSKSRKKDNKWVSHSCSSPAFGGFNFNSNPDLNPFIKLPAAYNPPPPPVYIPPSIPPPVFVQPPPLPPRPMTINPPLPPPPSFDSSNKYDPPKLLNPTQASPPTNISPPPPISESFSPSEVARSDGIGINVYPSIAPPNPEVPNEKIVDISKEEAWTDFVKGFARGLPKGSVDSIQEIPSAVATAVETTVQLHSLIYPIVPNREAISQVTAVSETISYLRTCSGSELAKIVAPEAHHLFTNWDDLRLEQRGEQLAHCIGKYGTDVLLPIAAAKGAKVAGGVLKEVSTLGKIEGVIGAGAKELETVKAVIGSSKLAQEAIPFAERQAVIEKTLLSERTQLSNTAQKLIIKHEPPTATTTVSTNVNLIAENEKMINSYLGEGTRLIKNKAGDLVFLSKDGLRRVRFDFIRPEPHLNPHMHVEYYINGEWKGSSQIYPFDVPHN